jgi:20S proteasome alpha/beta subunit
MSTCIAAITGRAGIDQQEDSIVTASDTRLSFGGDFSADGSTKIHVFHREWATMIAGDDIAQHRSVIERARVLLRGKSGKLTVVMDAFKKAYQDEFRAFIEDGLLSRFGMTMEDFKKRGKTQLLPEVFTEFSLTIKIASLGCRFLVYGLDDKKIGHIFTVSNPGKCELRDKPGFWAIGKGATSALSMLAALKQVRGRSTFEETIYNVLAAKYISEGASDVGRETYLFIKKYGTDGYSNKLGLEEEIRKIWETEGRPITNAKAVNAIVNGEFLFFPRLRYRLRKKLVALTPPRSQKLQNETEAS